jgi:hypothetical protein
MAEARRIVRLESDRFALRLGRQERRVLAALPGQLRALIEARDPAVARLFPPAYPDDPDRESEYRRMVGTELLEGRREALEVMEATVRARQLDRDQLSAWLAALNDVRLVLGTQLDVTEDAEETDLPEDDPQAPTLALYHYLGWLVAQAVEALDDGDGDDGPRSG